MITRWLREPHIHLGNHHPYTRVAHWLCAQCAHIRPTDRDDVTTSTSPDALAPRFRHGLVLGRFYPPHHGHDHLIRAAVRECDRVTVEVIGSPAESIEVVSRAEWLHETHPTVRIAAAIDENPVNPTSPAARDAHAQIVEGLLDAPVDAIFSGDDDKAGLAERLDAEWVRIDPDREANPVSGADVRADLAGWWSHLSPPVRSGLIRRVVVLGAESTGTTTLTEALADLYATNWVPDYYGHDYREVRQEGPLGIWRSEEFDVIVERQENLEEIAARRSPSPVLFCDTDVLTISIWHERRMGWTSPTVAAAAAAHRPLLYVLTGDDIPWEDDGVRDDEDSRPGMQQRFRDVLAAQETPWIEVRGTVEERLHTAAKAVDMMLERAFRFRAADDGRTPEPQAVQPSSSGSEIT